MRRFHVDHDISCETQLLELVSLNSVGHPVLWSSCCPSFSLSIVSLDSCFTAQICAPATDRNLENDCVMIRPSSTDQEKVPFSQTSAHHFYIFFSLFFLFLISFFSSFLFFPLLFCLPPVVLSSLLFSPLCFFPPSLFSFQPHPSLLFLPSSLLFLPSSLCLFFPSTLCLFSPSLLCLFSADTTFGPDNFWPTLFTTFYPTTFGPDHFCWPFPVCAKMGPRRVGPRTQT